jgi:hypothetical protein
MNHLVLEILIQGGYRINVLTTKRGSKLKRPTFCWKKNIPKYSKKSVRQFGRKWRNIGVFFRAHAIYQYFMDWSAENVQ